MADDRDEVIFEDDLLLALALAQAASPGASPRPDLRNQLLAKLVDPPAPKGFSFAYGQSTDWLAHPVPGIRMKVLAVNPAANYATLLLDVAPGTRFPTHHHGVAEECYVLTGSLHTCGRKLAAGDFVHADADTDHGELYTEEGCQVLLVVEPEEFMLQPTALPPL